MKKIKQIPQIMRLASLMLLIALIANGINICHAGPTITSAGHADINTSIAKGYLNSAIIDYSPNCGTGCSAAAQLNAISSSNAGTIIVYLDDGVSTDTVMLPGYTGDIVLGNNSTTTTDYLLGVVYVLPTTAPCPFDNDVFMDLYDISGVGTGTITHTAIYKAKLINSGNGYANLYPHIDIIADYADFPTINIGGLPLCDQFVVSWTDSEYYILGVYDPMTMNCSSPLFMLNTEYGVNLYLGSLNSIGSPQVINGIPTPNPSYWADVCAVQRAPSGAVVAYFTYTDDLNEWYKDEWEFGSLPSSLPVSLGSSMDIYPRIDAIDDYTYNNDPSSPPTTNFDWVAVNNTTGGVARLQPGYPYPYSLPAYLALGGWSPFVADLLPVVSCGSQTYTVAYDHPNAFNSFLTAPGLDWTISIYPTSSPASYTRVNFSTAVGALTPAISSTCNNDGTFGYANNPQILACWDNGTVFYKDERNVTSWKPGGNTGVNSKLINKTWLVSPNPATDQLTITVPANTENASYKICDITGREILRADISGSNEKADIGCLVNGMYILHIYEAENEVKTMKFVKE